MEGPREWQFLSSLPLLALWALIQDCECCPHSMKLGPEHLHKSSSIIVLGKLPILVFACADFTHILHNIIVWMILYFFGHICSPLAAGLRNCEAHSSPSSTFPFFPAR